MSFVLLIVKLLALIEQKVLWTFQTKNGGGSTLFCIF